MKKQRIVFDFDGVIHKYSKGWQNGSIYDTPVEGIKQLIDNLRFIDNYEVVIVSTRCSTQQGIDSINEWLLKYGIFVDGVMSEKPPAKIYIDDRAIKFNGNCQDLIQEIRSFKTWQE